MRHGKVEVVNTMDHNSTTAAIMTSEKNLAVIVELLKHQ